MKEIGDYYGMSRPEVAYFIPKNIGTILDIGCGKGLFLKLVLIKAKEIIANIKFRVIISFMIILIFEISGSL